MGVDNAEFIYDAKIQWDMQITLYLWKITKFV